LYDKKLILEFIHKDNLKFTMHLEKHLQPLMILQLKRGNKSYKCTWIVVIWNIWNKKIHINFLKNKRVDKEDIFMNAQINT